MSTRIVSQQTKDLANQVGFDAVGLTPIDTPKTLPQYEAWLSEGRHGDMDYLAEHLPLKADPTPLLPGAKSWIFLAIQYDTPEKLSVELKDLLETNIVGWVARYARGRDYHKTTAKKLDQLIWELQKRFPSEKFRPFVDSGPVLERDLASRAGLGWVGKNTCLIDETRGSFFFICEILTTMTFEYDTPPVDRCGTCTKCLDICPTNALVSPRKLDATKCISYWTIETEKAPPADLVSKMGSHLVGCDLCQDVCPWNQRARKTGKSFTQNPNERFPTEGIIDLRQLLETPAEVIELEIQGTPLNRVGVKKLKARAKEILSQRILS